MKRKNIFKRETEKDLIWENKKPTSVKEVGRRNILKRSLKTYHFR